MGCDGGTIPRRDELVKVKKKPEMKDKNAELMYKWMHCAISQQPLQDPTVMCGYGKLYNKMAVLEVLLGKDQNARNAIKHIKTLKDVKDLRLTRNPVFRYDQEQRDKETGIKTSPFICPVTGIEMSGKFRFVALWSCGCVFSERVLKEVDTRICHNCQRPFEERDVVILNAVESDMNLMQQRLDSRLRSRKNKVKIETITSNSLLNENGQNNDEQPTTSEPIPICSSTQNGQEISKATDEVQHKEMSTTVQEIDKKSMPSGLLKRPHPSNESGSMASPPSAKAMKTDYSVAKDPDATDVYKSLFTTHKSEREQDRAHWVTYNPFYN